MGPIIVAVLVFMLIGMLIKIIVSAAGRVGSKRCPACAERVKRAASVCRYCHHDFTKPPLRAA